jgi:hypothetical protein
MPQNNASKNIQEWQPILPEGWLRSFHSYPLNIIHDKANACGESMS